MPFVSNKPDEYSVWMTFVGTVAVPTGIGNDHTGAIVLGDVGTAALSTRNTTPAAPQFVTRNAIRLPGAVLNTQLATNPAAHVL
jgi:hypothetical protein